MLENSPPCNELSLNEEECKEAATKLGLTFQKNKPNANKQPNACHLDYHKIKGIYRTWWNEADGKFGNAKYWTVCKTKLMENEGLITMFSVICI